MQDDIKLRLGCECCIRYEDEVLMQRRHSKSKFYPNLLSFPGGKVDFGETSLSAIIREVKEEAHLDINPVDLMLCGSIVNYHIDKNTVWQINTFRIRYKIKPKVLASNEGKLEWINVKEILNREDIVPPVYPYLTRIFNDDVKTFFMSADLINGYIVKINSELALTK